MPTFSDILYIVFLVSIYFITIKLDMTIGGLKNEIKELKKQLRRRP